MDDHEFDSQLIVFSRFFPAMQKVNEIIAEGTIGDVVNVQGDFGWYNHDCPYPDDRIWNKLSGGMTYDIGMYMAHLGQVAYPNSEVERIQAMATMKNGTFLELGIGSFEIVLIYQNF